MSSDRVFRIEALLAAGVLICIYALFFEPLTVVGVAAALTFALIFWAYVSFRDRPMPVRLGILIVCFFMPFLAFGYLFWRIAAAVRRKIDRDAAENRGRRARPE